MRTSRWLVLISAVVVAVWTVYAGDDTSSLRSDGQAGVDRLFAQWTAAAPEQRRSLEEKLDRVCAQKDCASSRLFWYTDLDEAKKAAQQLHRPILALHLLGRLDEELSCANSRLFRTLLYSDDSISTTLRDRYVLYWHSVRPVPTVTIEMGDGRVIRQTITGNSAHYLLDENGDVLDVLPGLYSPAVFHNQLSRWLELHASLAGADPVSRRKIVQQHHVALVSANVPVVAVAVSTPTAIDASKRVIAKSDMERPLLAQLQPRSRVPIADLQPLSQWMAIGEELMGDVQFSPAAVELIRKKQFGDGDVPPEEMRKLLDGIRRNVAADTAFNEQTMRPRIHQWFANGEVVDLDSLNERVYRELFLTPSDDPWLGLQPASVFTAIERSAR